MNSAKLSVCLKNAPFGVANCRITGSKNQIPIDYEICEMNESFKKLTGYSLTELREEEQNGLLPSKIGDNSKLGSLLASSIINIEERNITVFNKKNNKWLNIFIFPEDNSYFSLVIIDVTREKNTEHDLVKQNSMITYLFDILPENIFYKNIDGVYLGCNPAFAEYAGSSREDITGKTDYDIFNIETAEFNKLIESRVIDLLEPGQQEEYLRYPDGRYKLVETLRTPYLDPDGKIIGIIGISRGIAENNSDSVNREKIKEELNKLKPVIIIAEDIIMNIELLRSIILTTIPNAVIIEAKNGLEVINEVKKNRPDFIFMDVQMPEMDGIEAAKMIRLYENASENHKHIPIVALTASAFKEEKNKCFAAGMDDFLTKPINPEQVNRILEYFILPDNKNNPAKEKSKNHTIIHHHDNNKFHFDKHEFMKRINNNEKLYDEFIEESLIQFDSFIKSLEINIREENKTGIQSIAHSIKGTASNMCFNRLSSIAYKICKNANSESSSIKGLFKELTKEWTFLKGYIKK